MAEVAAAEQVDQAHAGRHLHHWPLDVLSVSGAYDTWLRPQEILSARFAKLVLQLDF